MKFKNKILRLLQFFCIHLFYTSCFAQQKEGLPLQHLKFDFGAGKVEQGYTQVTPQTIYNAQKGYGLEPVQHVTSTAYTGKDALRDDFLTGTAPFFFSVKVPEGNYNVTVILGDENGISVTTIKAESRRLMVEKRETKRGAFATQKFTVHVRDSLIRSTNSAVRLKPREIVYRHWDDKLTLEFSNSSPKVCAVEITPVTDIPTMFLAGNSTVVDQAEEPYAAWGQMIPAFFKGEKMAVANYAESGETLKAFKGERRLEKVWSMAKSGDYLFIEFAHNDQKAGSNFLDPFTTYKQTLKEWISEARNRNITPVLVTSMHRRNFDSAGSIINTLSDYPEAVRQTAKEEGVALIDLNAMSKVLYEAWGPVTSLKAFVHYPANIFPGQTKELKDDTHFNAYGAYELAKCVVLGIRKSNLPIAKFLKDDLPPFDPARPDDVEKWNLPMSITVVAAKPDGN